MKKRLTALLVSVAVLLALLVAAVGFIKPRRKKARPPPALHRCSPLPHPAAHACRDRAAFFGHGRQPDPQWDLQPKALRRARNAEKTAMIFVLLRSGARFLCRVRRQLAQPGNPGKRRAGTQHLSLLFHPGDLGRAAYDAGFRVFSLSNNHTYDKGAAGIAATGAFGPPCRRMLSPAGCMRARQIAKRSPFRKGRVRIAYLSYTEHTNGIRAPQGAEANVIYTSELEVMQRQLELARQQADLVIAGVHWGVEGSHTVTQAQRELAQKNCRLGRGCDHRHPPPCGAGRPVAHRGGWSPGLWFIPWAIFKRPVHGRHHDRRGSVL